MGLDMYLDRDVHVSRYNYGKGEEGFTKTVNEVFDKIVEAAGQTHLLDTDGIGLDVQIPVGYWRKANQIHNWFISNLGNGVDNCEPIYVSRDHLQELLDLCKQVKEGGEAAAQEYLPPTQGFFFGTYEIDEWYWEQIDYTITMIERVLADPNADHFTYRASW